MNRRLKALFTTHSSIILEDSPLIMVSLIPSLKSWWYHFMDNVCLKNKNQMEHISLALAIICIHVSGIQFPRSVIAAARKPIPCRYRRLPGCPSEVEISADHAFVASWQAWHEAQVTHLEIKSCLKKAQKFHRNYIWIYAIGVWHGLTGTYCYHSIVGKNTKKNIWNVIEANSSWLPKLGFGDSKFIRTPNEWLMKQTVFWIWWLNSEDLLKSDLGIAVIWICETHSIVMYHVSPV